MIKPKSSMRPADYRPAQTTTDRRQQAIALALSRAMVAKK